VPDIDWDKIKAEYITTKISQRKLAEKYGISVSALAARSSAEKWVELKEQFRNKTIAKTIEKTSTKRANRLQKLIDNTERAIEVASKALDDSKQFNRYIVEKREKYAFPTPSGEDGDLDETALISERQWAEEQIFQKIDTKALKDVTAVLKDLTALMRDLYGLPTQAEQKAQEIAAARLELDRKKAAIEDDNKPSGIEVVINAGPEEWNE